MAGSGHHASDVRGIGCAILTVSDTRSEADDSSGAKIKDLLVEAGHKIEDYRIVRDEPARIAWAIRTAPPEVRVVISNGGTGIAPRDTTYEAITQMLDKEITGFGELFRMLSYEQVGSAAMLSRATAGITGNRAVFVLPGSTKAVELAMTKLILPQLGHIVGLLGDR